MYVDSILLFRFSFVHASPVWFGLVLWAVGVALITLDHVLFTFWPNWWHSNGFTLQGTGDLGLAAFLLFNQTIQFISYEDIYLAKLTRWA